MKATSSTDAKKKPDIHLATSGARKERLPLGESLVKIGAISQEQLQDALRQQKHHKGVRLGRLLVKLGFISDDVMRQALSEQLNVPFVDLERMRIDPALGRIINHAYARRHCLLPVSSIGQSLTVCMDDPSDQTGTKVQTPVFEVRVRLENPAMQYLPGQRAYVRFTMERDRPLLWQWSRKFWQLVQTQTAQSKWL